MKKVLFITSRLINPVNSGTKVVLYNYCKGLKEKFNCEIYQFSFYENDTDKKVDQPNFLKEVRFANQPNIFERFWNILIKTMFFREWPFQVSLYFSKNTKKQLDEYINEIKPEIVICDLARTAEYVRDLDSNNFIKILEMQDLISKRYIRQAKAVNNSESPFGAYTNKIPHILRKFVTMKRLTRCILEYEGKLLSEYEIKVSEDFKNIILVSKNESDKLNSIIGREKCICVPLGVDYEYFSSEMDISPYKNLMGFIGNMNISHNKDAVNNFINNVFPKLLRNNPDLRFRIIGICTEEYKNKLEKNINVEVTGSVDDIRKYSKECSVMIAPLTYGSGIKTKVLESMAMGIPVITNKIGAEGINAVNKEEILIYNNDDELVKEINKLINDDTLRVKIAKQGKKYVSENFTWNKSIENFEKIFSNIE